VPFIDAFEVPPERDAAFVAAGPAGVVHRALRRDVLLRWVTVGEQPAALDVPFPRRGGSYEVVYEDGDVGGAGGVILIEAFDERFLAAWHAARDVLATQRGYLGSRLHRGDGDLRFVNIGRWSSPLMHFRATKALAPFATHAGLYEIVFS
jgi:hypothetical protein